VTDVAATVETSRVHAATATEPAPVKSATAATEATTSATASIGIIGDQACGQQTNAASLARR
jgi:hypothetical protein